jgi:hypothetical protein
MGLLGTAFSNMDAFELNLPYPAQTKQAAGQVDGVPTDVMVISFSDKIMVTITQAGRLAQWVRTHKYRFQTLTNTTRSMSH